MQTRGGAPKPAQEQRVARLAEPFGGSVGGYGQGSGPADGRLKQQQEGAIAQAQAPTRTAYRMPASAPAPTSTQDKGVAQAAEPAAASREQTDADAATYGRAATEALLARAEVEHARGDYAAVVKTLEQLFRSNPGYAAPRAFELLASAHERRGDTAKAAVVRKQAAERTGR